MPKINKVDNMIPIPKRAGRRSTKYPWSSMEVNDSFFVTGISATSMSSACVRRSERSGGKFTVRTVEEDGVKGVRVWRIE